MNNLNSSNAFVFNAEIDANYLNSLYGDDFVYLQEIFETVLVDYQSLTDNIEYSYSSAISMHYGRQFIKSNPFLGL